MQIINVKKILHDMILFFPLFAMLYCCSYIKIKSWRTNFS